MAAPQPQEAQARRPSPPQSRPTCAPSPSGSLISPPLLRLTPRTPIPITPPTPPWAGVIMPNACWKDNSTSGIRQSLCVRIGYAVNRKAPHVNSPNADHAKYCGTRVPKHCVKRRTPVPVLSKGRRRGRAPWSSWSIWPSQGAAGRGRP
ncbi:hypothetical protein CVT26_008430 [Gymnopilus dilepis]|uniref:Uncharacterized protein n=1 Tax=Gymnopilus dilepis TaxID=231916 RepID=A0A409YFT6_9AGAR|nr:hypothetical protein CVT26_008430 [Gymnopilus dilepis]